ncbi:hypothetical protein RhiXN_04390 [Rhizoctonia solani]|uniref:PI31 proteasome regulator N-terminal domain-containing protein n=1 Tax=Rhizoctonia solani TaxID=456999 RepID=A0A8H8SSA5_9AGAM|nr:uncharacterized protein RhiXN_04390 [Rhizoctonia solani]QRW16389.1 hypothetical protein RhiXN_04390 [Rhizoctonia solani]
MANALDASALLSKVANILPESNKTLVAIDEDTPAREPDAGTGPGLLPEGWNRKGPDVYTFKYKHEQSSFTFLLKLVGYRDDKTKTFEITTQDFTSASYFPYDTQSTDRPLVHGYISSSRVTDLVSLFKITPLSGSTTSTPASASSGQPGRAAPPPNPSPPPSFDRPFAHPYADPSRRNPLEIGRSDLDPLGGLHNPFAPPSLFSPPGAGGQGMGAGRRGQGGVGPWGGDGFLPPMGAPPGARFDPIGPGPLGGRGFPPRQPPRSGDPDNNEFMPPGSVSIR